MNFRLIPILFMSCIMLISCNNNSQNRVNENNMVEQSSYREEESVNNQQIADHLVTIAQQVPDVNDAAAIIAGPYAVVGIDIDEATERQRVGSIKYSVSEALKKDPYGKTALVVADADITTRIQEMGLKIQEGHPVQGIVDELAEIVGRYMPTFPVDEHRPKDPSENNEKITNENQEEMKRIKKEQSNQ